MAIPLRERWPFRGYRDEDQRPLGSYALLMTAWNLGLVGLLTLGRRRLKHRMDLGDTVLLGVATHKLTRLLARDQVTSPLRAPFTRFESKGSAGEVNETSRGEGLRRAVGDLVSCIFCLGPWVGLGLTGLYVAKPEAARVVGSVFALTATSDFLHRGYEWLGAELHRAEAREKQAGVEAHLAARRQETERPTPAH
ncbi:DUF1360 domain-containing protein [Archangium violaceum]|uniref:DUF1360 domain-containing protein n=1 Tax=Archangium violaceum TaxID=83451 RepID=UPI00194F1C9D|nr:DUF1360 domain-containing protein [Archangium violaceum]QRO01224.1 DUF1360 domain-containing protein [Archangium violaceum]